MDECSFNLRANKFLRSQSAPEDKAVGDARSPGWAVRFLCRHVFATD